MTITTRLYTLFSGRLVGQDAFGNRYYASKCKKNAQKRWVLYKGMAEPSKVPPEWHGWLHYTQDLPPTKRDIPHYAWEKPHLPNLTGTPNAYLPPGSLGKGGKRAASTSDYEPWKP